METTAPTSPSNSPRTSPAFDNERASRESARQLGNQLDGVDQVDEPTYQTAARRAAAMPLPERVPWEELQRDFIAAWGYPRGVWEPEHLEILGPTGSGKSWFERTVLIERARLRGSHVVILATKPADKTLQLMGWPIVETWPPRKGWLDNRDMSCVIYWAKAPTLDDAGKEIQKRKVRALLSSLWRPDSNIILVFDEIAYVEIDLGLRTEVARYYREARALGITIVASTQRAQGVSRYVHSESVWSVGFTPKDDDDAERMAQVFGNKFYYRRVFDSLDRTKREFVLVHNLTNERYISHIPNVKKPSGEKRSRVSNEVPKNTHHV
jgi:hypothetical protein